MFLCIALTSAILAGKHPREILQKCHITMLIGLGLNMDALSWQANTWPEIYKFLGIQGLLNAHAIGGADNFSVPSNLHLWIEDNTYNTLSYNITHKC